MKEDQFELAIKAHVTIRNFGRETCQLPGRKEVVKALTRYTAGNHEILSHKELAEAGYLDVACPVVLLSVSEVSDEDRARDPWPPPSTYHQGERDTPERRAEYAAHILSFDHSREEIAEHSAAAICLREQVIADLEDEIRRMTGGEG